jgi:hypothetical protein
MPGSTRWVAPNAWIQSVGGTNYANYGRSRRGTNGSVVRKWVAPLAFERSPTCEWHRMPGSTRWVAPIRGGADGCKRLGCQNSGWHRLRLRIGWAAPIAWIQHGMRGSIRWVATIADCGLRLRKGWVAPIRGGADGGKQLGCQNSGWHPLRGSADLLGGWHQRVGARLRCGRGRCSRGSVEAKSRLGVLQIDILELHVGAVRRKFGD